MKKEKGRELEILRNEEENAEKVLNRIERTEKIVQTNNQKEREREREIRK